MCGYHIRESGANPAQEMAYAFCIAKAYADEVLTRGLPIDEFAGRLSFNFNIFGNLFEQVAKFRAGRGLWAKIMKEQYGATGPGSMWLRMIAGGGGGGLTFEQPEINIVRGAYYALISALVGRADDGAVLLRRGLHHPERVRAAHLAAHDAAPDRGDGPGDTVDPLGGSYYVETLTNQMRAEMERIMAEVDARGRHRQAGRRGRDPGPGVGAGLRACSATSSPGEFRKVGVNCYRIDEERSTRSSSIPTTRRTRACRSRGLNACAPSATHAAVARALGARAADARSRRATSCRRSSRR